MPKKFNFQMMRAHIKAVRDFDQPYVTKELCGAIADIGEFSCEVLDILNDNITQLGVDLKGRLQQLEEFATGGGNLPDEEEPEEVDLEEEGEDDGDIQD